MSHPPSVPLYCIIRAWEAHTVAAYTSVTLILIWSKKDSAGWGIWWGKSVHWQYYLCNRLPALPIIITELSCTLWLVGPDRCSQYLRTVFISPPQTLDYGVPKGSVLGSIFFTIYTVPIGDIVLNIQHVIPPLCSWRSIYNGTVHRWNSV